MANYNVSIALFGCLIFRFVCHRGAGSRLNYINIEREKLVIWILTLSDYISSVV